eukprot:TRINITY_DN3643_c0_g1_i1.p1 TRINITY_DN3643_c0_g1~~TRINITY_DN3643_c0_g1_i1.p1  ORF type:complete len:314 (+),score=71.06 TRINITY_DN3643_c0_g1_i1:342-1283(+)
MSAQFLQRELPIRIAKRVRELERLPHGLANVPSIIRLIALYTHSFWELMEFDEIKTEVEEQRFTTVLEKILEAHSTVREHIADGLQELVEQKKLEGKPLSERADLRPYLDSFYLTRIGLRLLAGQHVKLHSKNEGYVGIIQRECYPIKIAKEAAEDAADMCRLNYGEAPKVIFLGDQSIHFPYVPSHLYYIFFELLKNSMRAVCEIHGRANELPPVTMTFGEGDEFVTVKISDQGGGIPRSAMARVWTYAYSDAQIMEHDGRPPMAGYGHGLPFSRLYTRYFGGDLNLLSVQGFGTDAYVDISKLGNIDEQLP